MKASPPAAIEVKVPGQSISPKDQNRRRRRSHIRGVLSSVSEFISTMRPKSNGYVLEYYDVCLLQDDVENLKYDNWLSDTNIEYYFEYLDREVIPESRKDEFMLVRPSVAFLIQRSADLSSIATALPPNLRTARYIFLAVNNNDDPSIAEGGSHWSLLAVSAEHGVALHYDSLNGCNEDQARATTSKLASLLRARLAFHSMPTPQQDNSSDCGIYVLLATNVLVQRLLNPEGSLAEGSNPWSLENVEFHADTGRIQFQKMITEMIESRGRKIGTKVDIEITPSPNQSPQQQTTAVPATSRIR